MSQVVSRGQQAWTRGDRPRFNATVRSRETDLPINVTGAQAYLVYWFNNKSATIAQGTIVDGPTGRISYQFLSPGLPDSGLMRWHYKIVDPSGAPFYTDEVFSKKVRDSRG